MAQRSSHLVAYANVTASSTNIPAAGTSAAANWLQLTLLDPATGAALTGNVLPAQCTRVQFGGVGFILGVDSSSTPTWSVVAAAQAQELDVFLGGAGKKVAVQSAGAALSTGTFNVYFYA